MKKTWASLSVIAALAAGLLSFTALEGGSIKGSLNPANSAIRVWALNATDTFRTTVGQGSAFEISNVKAGVYKIIVEATPPFKNTAKDSVTVTDGNTTDIGEIKVNQ